MSDIDKLCEVMHDAYEAAAPAAGWQTQERSRKPWADVPEANKATMRAAVAALLDHLAADPAVIDRVARGLFLEAMPGCEGAWDAPSDGGRESWRIKARAALAALAGDQPEPPVSLSVQRRLDVMRGDRDE